MAALGPTIAAVSSALAAAAPVIQTVGTIAGVGGTIATGLAANAAAKSQADQLEQQANDAKGKASIEAQQYDRQRRLALSRIRNVAAASGFSADDPTTLDILGDTDAYGTYQADLVRYGGSNRAAGLMSQAAASRQTGAANLVGSVASAAGTLASSTMGWAQKYGEAPEAGAMDIRPEWARGY